ncbi:MAG: hypothetical protein IJ164_09550 [Duodenibacillus sp.]|nr:hypothetical protein [Duodenibacillus sp.]
MAKIGIVITPKAPRSAATALTRTNVRLSVMTLSPQLIVRLRILPWTQAAKTAHWLFGMRRLTDRSDSGRKKGERRIDGFAGRITGFGSSQLFFDN